MGNPVRIRPKYKTESEWLSLNPVLRHGELVFSILSNEVLRKIGNGIDTYSNLPFCEDRMIDSGTVLPPTGREGQLFLLLEDIE